MTDTPTPVSDLIVKQFRAGEAHSDSLIMVELENQLAAVTEQRDEAREKVATMVLAGDYNDLFIAKVTGNLAARAEITKLKSQLTQTRGAVTISRNGYVRELEEQRDRLAEALNRLVTVEWQASVDYVVGQFGIMRGKMPE